MTEDFGLVSKRETARKVFACSLGWAIVCWPLAVAGRWYGILSSDKMLVIVILGVVLSKAIAASYTKPSEANRFIGIFVAALVGPLTANSTSGSLSMFDPQASVGWSAWMWFASFSCSFACLFGTVFFIFALFRPLFLRSIEVPEPSL